MIDLVKVPNQAPDEAKATKQEPSALAIKFFRGAKSRIWWKIEGDRKARHDQPVQYFILDRGTGPRRMGEGGRKWVVEDSVDLVRETDAFRDAVQAGDAATSELKAQIHSLEQPATGWPETTVAVRSS